MIHAIWRFYGAPASQSQHGYNKDFGEVAQRHHSALPPHDHEDHHISPRGAHVPTWGLYAYPSHSWGIYPQFPIFGLNLVLLGGEVGGVEQDWYGLSI